MAADRDAGNIRVSDETLLALPLRYPNERFVTLLARHFGDRAANAGRRGLDVGYGSGRHLRLLLDFGFDVSGVEYAPNAADVARRELADTGAALDLVTGAIGDVGFPPGTFTVTLSSGVATLSTPAGAQADLALIHGWTVPGGRVFVDFRTRDNWFATFGDGDRTSIVLDERAGPYAGMTFCFLDMDEAAQIVEDAGWRVDDVERVDLWREQAGRQHSWWIFDAVRSD
jgi:SAM-dependent methyltransferase